MDTLGTRIAEHRKRRQMSQELLAEKMNVTAQAVSKWENDISCPDIALLPQLADYFNTSVDMLLRGDRGNGARLLPEAERKSFEQLLLRISITSSDGDIVKINLPLSLIKLALDLGTKLPVSAGTNKMDALKDIDFNSILMAAEKGVMGKLLEIVSSDGDEIDIVIE